MWLELRESRSVLFSCSISLCSSFTSTEAAGPGEESGATKRQEDHTKQYKHGGVREKGEGGVAAGEARRICVFSLDCGTCVSLRCNQISHFPPF